jgi:DNA-binding transcriptional LysR family regulator
MGRPQVSLKSRMLHAAINLMDTRKLDLNLLVTFESLLAERNVSRAATRLGLSQPAVSAQLARLRDVFCDRLFVPAQRGIVPTARALELEAPLRAALDDVRDVVTSARSFDPTRAELTVKIAASDYVQSAVLGPFAIDLRTRAPGVRIAAVPLDARALVKQAETGDVDLAITLPSNAQSTLRHVHLLEETYVCVLRRRHPEVSGRLTLQTFLGLEHVIVSPRGAGFWGPADEALAALGYRRRIVLSVSSFLVVPQIVARSNLAALIPQRIANDFGRMLQAHKAPIEVEGFSLSLIWHERTNAHAAHRWIRDALIEWARPARRRR